MAKVLDSVRTAEQAVVSVRVTEKGTPGGQESKKASRENDLRNKFALGVTDEFSKAPWGQPIKLPEGNPAPPPIGVQLIEFIEPPEGAAGAHFDIEYTVEKADQFYRLSVTVTIRTNIEEKPVAQNTFTLSTPFAAGNLDDQTTKVKDELISRMVGLVNVNQPGPGGPVMPKGIIQPPKWP
jgi:hypothetical protein